VNGVAPGPMGTELFCRGKSEGELEIIRGFSRLGCIGEPEEVAEVVAFLSGEGSRWMSGQVVRVNGGMAEEGSARERMSWDWSLRCGDRGSRDLQARASGKL